MPSPLENFLHMYTGGQQTLTPEMYAHFGGDQILEELRKYNPEAKWVDTEGGGGEGATTFKGKKLDFGGDGLMRVPTPKSGIAFEDLRPKNFGSGGLHNDKLVYDDDQYGQTTHSSNIKRKVEGLEKWAPYIGMAIAMGAPIGAGMLAASGIGLGAAGATSAVTGGAAGLGAGSIPGAMGAGTFTAANAPAWASSAARQAPGTLRSVGSMGSTGDWDITKFLPMLASAFGVDPSYITAGKTGMSLAEMARAYQKQKGRTRNG